MGFGKLLSWHHVLCGGTYNSATIILSVSNYYTCVYTSFAMPNFALCCQENLFFVMSYLNSKPSRLPIVYTNNFKLFSLVLAFFQKPIPEYIYVFLKVWMEISELHVSNTMSLSVWTFLLLSKAMSDFLLFMVYPNLTVLFSPWNLPYSCHS